MQPRSLTVPDKVRRAAVSLGPPGRAWLRALPARIADIERRWGIRVGRSAADGSEAYVAEAVDDRGRDAMLKIKIPGSDPEGREARVLAAAGGRGYAALFRADEDGDTLLLERLGRQLYALGLPEDEQMEAICATLHEAWRAPAEEGRFPTGADKAARLGEMIRQASIAPAPPCSPRTLELALIFARRRRRAHDPRMSVLAHGDAHQWNTLRAPGSPTGFKFIDPDGVVAERAFDLAIPMREWVRIPRGDPLELGRHRCLTLARSADVDAQAIWEWALIQCVSNGLSLREIGADAPATVQLAMADAWSAAPLVSPGGVGGAGALS
jgi:streptomycin 6-kinase